MRNLEALSRDQVAPETQEVFDALNAKVGMVPNLYATVANSHKALTTMLSATETLASGEFNGKEVEAIALAVGQANGCGYCLSAHTTIGKMQGFTEEQTLEIRQGTIADEKLSALTTLANDIVISRGRPTQSYVDSFFSAGYSKASLAELIGLVALNTFTNYTNNLAGTEIDFPVAQEIPELATA